MLDSYAARWELALGELMAGGRLSACVAARDAGGLEVVLKVPTVAAAGIRELRALRRWSGCPVPAVVRADEDTGVFAMGRIRPGTDAGDDDPRAAAALLHRLHAVPAPGPGDGFPPLQELLRDRLRRCAQRLALPGNDTGRRLHDRAAALLHGAPAPPVHAPVLVHGDFQPKNLLRGPGGSLHAIDPLPCLGDPAFDAATWCVLSSSPAPIAERVDAMAACGWAAADVAQWAALLCALEYRPYRPEQAGRMLAYAGG